MESGMKKNNRKPAKAVIAFRFGHSVKEAIENIAAKENLDPTDIYSLVFAKGLTELYGFEVVGKELVA